MMLTRHDPATVCAPFSNYTNAVAVEGAVRWLHVSGQVGVDARGQLEDGFEAQCRRAFANIAALLDDARMDLRNVVKIGVFLTRADDVAAFRRIRDELMPARAASSLLIVAGLVSPDWLIEIEAVAAADL